MSVKYNLLGSIISKWFLGVAFSFKKLKLIVDVKSGSQEPLSEITKLTNLYNCNFLKYKWTRRACWCSRFARAQGEAPDSRGKGKVRF